MARLKSVLLRLLTLASTAGAAGGYVTYGCGGSSGGGDSEILEALMFMSLLGGRMGC